MQITALIQVINYLKEISGDPALINGYLKLAEVVRIASGNQHDDFSPAILKEKEQLRHFLQENDPSDWGYASYSLFSKFDKNQLFGKAAADYLENLITPENKDYKAIYSDLSKKIKLISKLSETLSRFRQLFDQVVPAEVFQFAEEVDIKPSLLIFFEGHLSVQKVADLERYARLWDGILSTFSRLTGEESLILDISSFRNGNVSLGVSVGDKTLDAIITGVVGILASLSLVLKIRKIQIEIIHLPLNNDLNELLEEEIRTLINQRALESVRKLISDYLDDTLDAEEMTDDMCLSLKQILSFVEKGGRIEFKPLLSTPESAKTNKTLIESYAIAHELENIIGQLTQALGK